MCNSEPSCRISLSNHEFIVAIFATLSQYLLYCMSLPFCWDVLGMSQYLYCTLCKSFSSLKMLMWGRTQTCSVVVLKLYFSLRNEPCRKPLNTLLPSGWEHKISREHLKTSERIFTKLGIEELNEKFARYFSFQWHSRILMPTILQDLLWFRSVWVFSSCLYRSASRSVARIRCDHKPSAASDLPESEQSTVVNSLLKFLYFMSGRRNMNHNMSWFCTSKVDAKYFYMVDTELCNMSCLCRMHTGTST